MKKTSVRTFTSTLLRGTGLAVLFAAGAGAALAQTTPEPAPDQEEDVVVIVGARAAQQSSNNRKKRARTSTDSIVADDVGAFPDRNISEAISRVAGVAVTRNEFGEGSGLNIRGNSADLTRVELDGMGVQNQGGLAVSGEADGRGADLRELPSDLIKSVDIVKGSTASMTEGSLGGSVQITTRTGLDFKKPYLSLRVGGTQNSLGKEWRPDFNLVASRKFFNDRLGVLVSVSGSKLQNNGHKMEMVTSNNAGYARSIDWDNSPEKTFAFNPETVSGPTINDPLASWARVGGGTVNSKSAMDVVSLSAQAQSKDQCNTLFPMLTDAELGTIVAGTSNANRTAAQTQRLNERLTCLNQWNDYHPSTIRNFMNLNDDERLSADIRFDYRVNDRLTVFAKYGIANRDVNDQTRNRNLGNVEINRAIGTVNSLDPGTAGRFYPSNSINNVTPTGAGYYAFNTGYLTGVRTIDINPNTGTGNSNVSNFTFPTYGYVLNVDPASIVVDENHHVTQYRINDASVGIDQISNRIITNNSFLQVGGDYKGDRLSAKFMASHNHSEYSREDKRTSISAPYGSAMMTVQPSGIWSYELPDTFDQTNPDNYVVVRPATGVISALSATVDRPASPAYTIAQQPLTSNSFQITYQPRAQESSESQAKIDLTYRVDGELPFFTTFRAGAQMINKESQWWGSGGYTVKDAVGTFGQAGYQPPIVVPTLNLRGSFRACEPTAGSSGTGGLSCNYGYAPATSLSGNLTGVHTFTTAELKSIFQGIFREPDAKFFDGYPGAGELENWPDLDIEKLWAQVGSAQNANLDCLKVCKGSDGQMYAQPISRSQEHNKAVYFEADFEQQLPFGMMFDGNVGARIITSQVSGTGILELRSTRKNADWSPTNDAAVTTFTYRQPVTFQGELNDILPSYNFNLWLVPDKLVTRYYTGETVAFPGLSKLLPDGICTFDERREATLEADGTSTDMTCSGTFGNPGLQPYQANNAQLSLEWYPNKDTMMSLAYHKLNVHVGGPIARGKSDGKLFAGSGVIDPETGQSVEDMEFTYSQYENNIGYGRSGWEFTSKTAFSFLPWALRHTGADLNISTLAGTENFSIVDPNTGDHMRPPGESEYYLNLSLWYDDGRTNARVSYQRRGESFGLISPGAGSTNTVNNYPGEWGFVSTRPVPYNPGSPRFDDETTYIDAKVTYKINQSLEVYLEGRNLTKQARTQSGGEYNGFAGDVKNLWQVQYGGVRTMFGLTYRMR